MCLPRRGVVMDASGSFSSGVITLNNNTTEKHVCRLRHPNHRTEQIWRLIWFSAIMFTMSSSSTVILWADCVFIVCFLSNYCFIFRGDGSLYHFRCTSCVLVCFDSIVTRVRSDLCLTSSMVCLFIDPD